MKTSSSKKAEGENLGAAAKHELAVECLYVALLQLMEVKPYESITITDICKRAGVSRMAYYRNYESKAEILTKRFEAIMEASVSKLESGGDVNEHAIVAEFFTSLQSHKIVQAMMRARLMDQFLRIHLIYARRAYQNILHLDLTDSAGEMGMYQRMGALAGLIMYLVDKNSMADPDELATMLLS